MTVIIKYYPLGGKLEEFKATTPAHFCLEILKKKRNLFQFIKGLIHPVKII